MRTRTLLASLACLFAFPLSAGEPDGLQTSKDSKGLLRVRMICHNPADDARLALLPKYPEIESLEIFGDKMSDEGLKHLKSLPRLQTLFIGAKSVTAAGLENIRDSRTIKELGLASQAIDAKTAAIIASLPKLEALRFNSCDLDAEAWKTLEKLPIREFQFRSGGPADLAPLKNFKNLESVILKGSLLVNALESLEGKTTIRKLDAQQVTLTTEGVRALGTLTGLIELSFQYMPLPPKAIPELAKVNKLRTLSLGSDQGDADLKSLKTLKQVQVLHLHSTKLSREGTTELRKAMPNTVVNRFGSKYTIEELEGIASNVDTDAAGMVTEVEMVCRKRATDAKLVQLRPFPTIETLRLFGGSDLTDEGLKELKFLPNLRVLELGSSVITEGGLKTLAELPNLKELEIQTGKVGREAIEAFRKARPDVKVNRE